MDYRNDRDAETLRETLRAIKDAKVGSKALLKQFHSQCELPEGEPAISVKTLDAFIRGRASKRPVAMAALFAWLRAHSVYSAYFPVAAAAEPSSVDPNVFAGVLSRFFTDPGAANTFVSAEEIETVFSGQFMLYRTDWSRRFFRVSKLDIWACDTAMRVTETQKFIDDNLPFDQVDEGVLWPYGRYAYFLTKETGGTRVMLGIISESYPLPHQKQPVEGFRGVVSCSSRKGMHHNGLFFCRRSRSHDPADFGIIKPRDIKDESARGYLLQEEHLR
jgi:hypothetical protein